MLADITGQSISTAAPSSTHTNTCQSFMSSPTISPIQTDILPFLSTPTSPVFGRSYTVNSLLGNSRQAWGYPDWIERALEPGSPTSIQSERPPSVASLPSPLHTAVEHASDEGGSECTEPPKITFRRSIASIMQGFRISRVLTEVSLSTMPLRPATEALESNSNSALSTAGTTVNNLRACDIKLLVCLGDSLLTGLCVTAHPSNLKNKLLATLSSSSTRAPIVPWMVSGEHRNNTCISGGGEGVVSVGRLLKVFSPTIVGLTQHKTYLFSRGSGFNFARTGSTVDNLTEQVHRYVNKLRRPEYSILENKWKLIFIWIGANNVFITKSDTIAATFEADLVRALQVLKSLVSHAYVCVLTLPDLSRAHIAVSTEKRRALITSKTMLVNLCIRRAVSNYVWNDTDSFKVVLQPLPVDVIEEDQYSSFISELDRVHPNFLAQQLFAKCIWNNLWLPPDQKLFHLADVIESPWAKPLPDDRLA
ncbi:hypothetical protein BASA50_007614 [Batrachochytrium salamandrivorans]|uniref:SGNH hydrolase-type esterase domain-containing protein n=1 Tax=Batrachochytrium salamandrivorans TaxID=1357716 RepID=A0ABQ8F707_9FUNG|nr:hypothetical protein BASA60_005638 [Batrachochytrium salamandrivorans]KAH6578133.1 hypothetical protein BASA62_000425 [Batrachochytrium salamandrivorans]KAH6593094.1 hypothetical protein BASA50_007614 [Batrachochytrium salamandrivorans]